MAPPKISKPFTTELRDMRTKNDEWIKKIQELEAEIKIFQESGAGTPEVGVAMRSLAEARFWLQEDKQINIVSTDAVLEAALEPGF